MTSAQSTRLASLLALGFMLAAAGCQRERGSVEAEPARTAAEQAEANAGPGATVERALAPEARPATSPTVQQLAPVATAATDHVAGSAGGEPSAATSAALGIKRLVVTHAIADREPVPAASISAGAGQVFAFIEAKNEGDDSGQIVVTFEHSTGERVGFVKLDIPKQSSRWRTWARSANVKKSGNWTAVVRDASGAELARQAFEVQS